MPLLNHDLTLWEIAFRWNGLDPDNLKYRFYLPLKVKDSFRLIAEAILEAQLESSLSMDKWNPNHDSDQDLGPEFYIRYHLNDIHKCIANKHFNQKFLKFVWVDRYAFMLWCKSLNIPLPEFWFPSGWNYNPNDLDLLNEDNDEEGDDPKGNKLKTNQRTTIACQEIAKRLWRDHPEMTIASMVRHDVIQNLGGAANYEDATVRCWLKSIAPDHVRNKPGRPRKDKK